MSSLAPRGAALAGQAGALLGLRAKLWWRRFVLERQWGRAAAALFGAAAGGLFSFSLGVVALERAGALLRNPRELAAGGGPLTVFAAWLSAALLGRIWFALVPTGQQSFLDPRRFRAWPVPAGLVSAINVAAIAVEPAWLLIYPPLVAAAVGISRLPGAPPAWALLLAEGLAVWSTVGVLHLGAAVAAVFDARPLLRRGLAVLVVLAGLALLQHSIAVPALLAGSRSRIIAWTPPGWAALFAGALAEGNAFRALAAGLLLLLLGLLSTLAAHALSLRESLRPPAPVRAAGKAGSGFCLPLLPDAFSALFEKEAKTVLRTGWLQLVLVPVAFLILMQTKSGGAQPLLVAAVYAHLGVLEISTNGFGRDLSAARAFFLWPVSLRLVLAAKNAVAYCFSLLVYLLLALVAWTSSRVEGEQVLAGLLAHAAIFPLLATLGNALSALFPMPVRGARLRRVRGAGPLGARLLALVLLAGAGWAPYLIAQALGLPLWAAYGGALVSMSVAYLGLLSACARLLDGRREALLAALAKDE